MDVEIKIVLDNGKSLTKAKYDGRTPGLFKVEKTGVALIALTCKTNYLLNEEDKLDKRTMKGGQLKRNKKYCSYRNYKKSLFLRKQIKRENMGFRYMKSEGMKTYKSKKVILSPLYTKAVIMRDGIHIRPL